MVLRRGDLAKLDNAIVRVIDRISVGDETSVLVSGERSEPRWVPEELLTPYRPIRPPFQGFVLVSKPSLIRALGEPELIDGKEEWRFNHNIYLRTYERKNHRSIHASTRDAVYTVAKFIEDNSGEQPGII